MAPEGQVLAAVAIVPRGTAKADVPRATAAMTRVHDLVVDAGGKRYLLGWFPRNNEAFWRQNFEDAFDRWIALRRACDPAESLRSALFRHVGV